MHLPPSELASAAELIAAAAGSSGRVARPRTPPSRPGAAAPSAPSWRGKRGQQVRRWLERRGQTRRPPPQRNRDSAPSTRGSRSRIAGVRTEIASLETRPQRRGLRGHRAVPPTKVAHRPRVLVVRLRPDRPVRSRSPGLPLFCPPLRRSPGRTDRSAEVAIEANRTLQGRRAVVDVAIDRDSVLRPS